MSEIKPPHSAPQSAAGYLYQVRVALVGALRYAYRDSGIGIAIEKFDDVSFERDGTPFELLQTKHHLTKRGNLTDASPDMWKTIRVWAEATKADPSLPSHTRFMLVTTAQAPTGSAASYLCPTETGNRDPALAEAKLLAACDASRNKGLLQAVAVYKGLTPEMRKALVTAIEIIDSEPRIGDVEARIDDSLRMIAARGKVELAREQLEGWWWARICKALQSDIPDTVFVADLEQKLDGIREGLTRDALPFDMEHVDPPQVELAALDEMCFVRQLRSIGISPIRMQYAKRDFYRASTQRSQWARNNLLFDGEVGQFDSTLIEEWQPRFARMCDTLDPASHESVLREAGQTLYGWVETDARFPLRKVESRFLNVGSYHILADDLRVGWHRDYRSVCRNHEKEFTDAG